MPEPMRTSTRPSTSSAISASRTDGRDTPSCLARSRSGGRRAPAPNSPDWISAADLVGDLPVQPARFDAVERHGGSAARGRSPDPRRRRAGPSSKTTRPRASGQVVLPISRPAGPRIAGCPPRPSPAIRATPVTVPLEAPLLHSNGAHWGRFVRTVVEVETADGYVGPRRDGRRRRGRDARVRRARGLPRGPRRVPARGDALRDLQPDREPLQQPDAAARGDRVRLPRHHRPEARRAGARAARAASCATRSSSRATSSSATRIRTPARARCAPRSSWSRTRGR